MNANAQHTPGPWHRNVPPASHYPTIFAGRNKHVAQVVTRGLSDSEIEANTNLIAAAPDLLSALIDAVATIKIHSSLGMPESAAAECWQAYQHSPEMKRFNAAIAKATGAAS